jgi:hypothetical protein
MALLKLIPKVFYSDIKVGIALFVDCMQFRIVHDDLRSDHPFCIAARDNVTVHLVEDDEYARKDRPEIRIATDDIDTLHADIANRHPQMLHPNGKAVVRKPWGVREFALLDASGVCIIFEQP